LRKDVVDVIQEPLVDVLEVHDQFLVQSQAQA
jgi:hypothetical protein